MAATNPGTSNLVEYYPFDDVTFTSSVEGIHANKNLDTTNTPTIASTKKHGNAIQFTRANEELAMYDVAYPSSGFPVEDEAFSVSVWVRLDSLSGIQDIVGVNESGPVWKIACNSNNYIYFQALTESEGTKYCNWTSAPSIDTWYHIVAYHDPVENEFGLIVNNGTPVTTAASSGVATTTSAARFQVGYLSIDYWLNGIADELSIWDKVLSANEIEWLYNSGNGQTYGASVGNASTGGDSVYYRNDNTIHYFLTDGDFICAGEGTVDYLLVAGGGGGGYQGGGGGGGGGVLEDTEHPVTAKTYEVVIGAGGAYGSNYATKGHNGDNSTFDGFTALGGGGGGSRDTELGADGGCGGGGCTEGSGQPHTGGTGSQGGDGGTGGTVSPWAGAGGGGASPANGGNGGANGGNGGAGYTSSISGSSENYAGGGGGGKVLSAGSPGTGVDGGGNGGETTANGSPGTANTGGGGGGGGDNRHGGNGGSGIVIISYPIGSLGVSSFVATVTMIM